MYGELQGIVSILVYVIIIMMNLLSNSTEHFWKLWLPPFHVWNMFCVQVAVNM